MSVWIANLHAALGDAATALDIADSLADFESQNGYIQYRLTHVLAELGQVTSAMKMLNAAVDNGFLSVQLLRQEEILGLAPVCHQAGYAAVARRLDANVQRCKRTYATRSPGTSGGRSRWNEEISGDRGKE